MKDFCFKTTVVTGVLTLIYCLVPIIQDKAFSSFHDRFNDHFVLFLSSGVYGFMQLVYTNSAVVYITQVMLWLLLWGISYLVVRFFTR